MTAARRMQLARLGVWIGLATVAVLTAVVTARTETGVRRIATLLSTETPEAARTARATAQQIAARSSDQEAEYRRLNEAIRALVSDRDRLVARVGALERNLDDVTGSIAPAARAPAVQLPPAGAVVPPAGTSLTVAPRMPLQTPPAIPQAASQSPAPSSPNRVSAGHLATGNTGPLDSVATKTDFGIDVGGNTSVDGLRTLWTSLKAAQPALFDGLRPVIMVRDGPKPGSIELRLLAGPLANAGVAARLCAALSAAGQTCQPSIFDGQRLALQ